MSSWKARRLVGGLALCLTSCHLACSIASFQMRRMMKTLELL